FAWPGVGRLLVEAVRARDYPVVTAAAAVSALLVVAGNLLAEFGLVALDPRPPWSPPPPPPCRAAGRRRSATSPPRAFSRRLPPTSTARSTRWAPIASAGTCGRDSCTAPACRWR